MCIRDSGYPVRSLYFDTLHDRDFAEKLFGTDPRRKVRLLSLIHI